MEGPFRFALASVLASICQVSASSLAGICLGDESSVIRSLFDCYSIVVRFFSKNNRTSFEYHSSNNRAMMLASARVIAGINERDSWIRLGYPLPCLFLLSSYPVLNHHSRHVAKMLEIIGNCYEPVVTCSGTNNYLFIHQMTGQSYCPCVPRDPDE